MLVFDRDTQALTGEAGELGRVEPSPNSDCWGRMVVAGQEHEIGRHATHGWEFQLESGEQVLWRFHAGWRRGGVLEGQGARLHLSSALVRTGRWKLAGRDQGRVRIRRQDKPMQLHLSRAGEQREVITAGWRSLTVETDGVFWEAGDGLCALTFACWLVGEWEATPGPPGTGV